MHQLRSPAETAMIVFNKISKRDIARKVEQLRRKAVLYEKSGGKKGIPFKWMGKKRYYYLEFWGSPDGVAKPDERVAAWLQR